MSLLRRLFNYRQETTQRVYGTTTSKAAPPTFVPDLIQEEVWNRDDVEHQGKIARQDPVAHYITDNIAENVFDDWFEFYLRSDVDRETPIMQDIQAELKRMQAKHFLTQALAAERRNGHSWLYVGTEDYRTDDAGNEIEPRVANLDFFSAEDAVVDKFDELGRPLMLKIEVMDAQNNIQYRIIPASDCIMFRTRPFDRSYMGQSVLAPVWDELVNLRFIKYGMAIYAMKIGIGLLVAKAKGKLTAELVAAIEDMLINAGPRRGMVYADRDIEKIEFLQASAGATDFPAWADTMLGQIAAGTGIPKDIIEGASAGAITGSEVNSKALYATLQKIQSTMEPYIRELVKRMGHDAEDYDIVWNTRYATNELEQAQIRLMNAQAAQMEQSTENMAKGINPYDIGIKVKDERSQKDDDKTRNPEGRQARV